MAGTSPAMTTTGRREEHTLEVTRRGCGIKRLQVHRNGDGEQRAVLQVAVLLSHVSLQSERRVARLVLGGRRAAQDVVLKFGAQPEIELAGLVADLEAQIDHLLLRLRRPGEVEAELARLEHGLAFGLLYLGVLRQHPEAQVEL